MKVPQSTVPRGLSQSPVLIQGKPNIYVHFPGIKEMLSEHLITIGEGSRKFFLG